MIYNLVGFILQTNPCKHPIIFMRDVEFEHLQSLLEFMYAGEVNISQAELPTFLRTAESLQIRGLTDSQSNQHNNEKVSFRISLRILVFISECKMCYNVQFLTICSI